MTYIISPSWVYWTGICNVVGIILGIIAIFSGIAVATCIVARIVFTFSDYEEYEHEIKTTTHILKISIIVFVITVLGAIFIPSQETMIMMKATELATKENMQYTSQQLKELIDYIITAIKTING